MIALFVLTGALGAARLLAAWGTGSAGVLADGVHSAALAALCLAVTAAPRRLPLRSSACHCGGRVSGGLTLALSGAAFLAAVFVARLSAENLSSPASAERPTWAVSLLVVALVSDVILLAWGVRSKSGAVEFCARLRAGSAFGGAAALLGLLAGGGYGGAAGLFVCVATLYSCWKAAGRGWKEFLTRRAGEAEAELFSQIHPGRLLSAKEAGFGRAAVWRLVYEGEGNAGDIEARILDGHGLHASVEFAPLAEDAARLVLARKRAARLCARDPRVNEVRCVRLAGSGVVLEVDAREAAEFPALARDIEEKLGTRLRRPVWVIRA